MDEPGECLVLREYERRVVPATVLAASGIPHEALCSFLGGLVTLTPCWGNTVELTASGRVGEVRIGRLHLRVDPGLPVGDVLALYAWCQGVRLDVHPEQLGVGGPGTTLAVLVAAALIDEVRRLLNGDLLRRSVHREERCVLLRGRPRFERAGLRPPGQPLECRFAEVSTDTLDNRLVRAGLEAALPWLYGHPDVRARAMQVLTVFRDLCSPLLPDVHHFERAHQQRGPRTEAYAPAQRLARWLLLGDGTLGAWGGGGVRGWTLDMPRLFEAAVTKAVTAGAARHGWRVARQPPDRFAIVDLYGGTYQEVVPDLEILEAHSLIAVVDAKYKGYGRGDAEGAPVRKLDAADAYQLAFYGSRSDPVPVFVVCPADPESPLADPWRHVWVGRTAITLVPVDVRQLVEVGEIDPREVRRRAMRWRRHSARELADERWRAAVFGSRARARFERTGKAEEIDLSPEDEEVLDQVWDRVHREGPWGL